MRLKPQSGGAGARAGAEPLSIGQKSGAADGADGAPAPSPRAGAASSIELLRRRLSELDRSGRPPKAVSMGVEAIDACLPAGGLARGALHEVAAADYRATPAALGFLIALALRLGGTDLVLWPRLRHDENAFGAPYAPGLRALGFDPGRLVLARCASAQDLLWTLEESTRLPGLGAVLGTRPPKMTLTQSRRLQLAAKASGTPVLLARAPGDDTPSAAVTRWRLAPHSGADDVDPFAAPRWRVTLEHARGGREGHWTVEWHHGAHRFDLLAPMALRAPDRRREA